MVLLALKEARAAHDLQRLLLGWVAVLNQVEQEQGGPHAIRLVFKYLLSVRDTQEFQRLDLHALGLGKTSEALMTHETFLINKGQRQATLAVILDQLRIKFSRLPPAIVTKIETADSDSLLLWSRRLVLADTLDAVFAD